MAAAPPPRPDSFTNALVPLVYQAIFRDSSSDWKFIMPVLRHGWPPAMAPATHISCHRTVNILNCLIKGVTRRKEVDRNFVGEWLLSQAGAGLNVFAPVTQANGMERSTADRTSTALALMTRNLCYMEDGVNDTLRDSLIESWNATRPAEHFNRDVAQPLVGAAVGAAGVAGQANRANNTISTAQAKAVIENFIANDIVKTESARGSSLMAVMYVAIASRGHVTVDKLEKEGNCRGCQRSCCKTDQRVSRA